MYTKILEDNVFAFAYRLFHEDFSSIGELYESYQYVCNMYGICMYLCMYVSISIMNF